MRSMPIICCRCRLVLLVHRYPQLTNGIGIQGLFGADMFRKVAEPVVLGRDLRPYGTRTTARTRLHSVQDFWNMLLANIVPENLT